MAVITAKTMEDKLKLGWTHSTFMQEYHITDDEFEAELHRIYTSEKSYSSIAKRLKANEKRTARHMRNMKDNKKTFIVPVVSMVPESTESQVEPAASVQEAHEENSSNSELAHVISLIKEKQSELTRFEELHKNSVARRRQVKNLLKSKETELNSLIKRLNLLKVEINSHIEDYNNEFDTMNSLSSCISRCREELTSLEAKRTELEKVLILANADGTIEIGEKKLDDSQISANWVDIHRDFYGKDFLDGITGAQAKQIAKLLAYTANLSNFEVLFDSPSVEEVYKTLKLNTFT